MSLFAQMILKEYVEVKLVVEDSWEKPSVMRQNLIYNGLKIRKRNAPENE